MPRIGGPIIPVKIVADEELVQNGGSYVLLGGPAKRLHGLDSADGAVEGGPAIPVYIVSDEQVASGQFVVEGGNALPAIDYLNDVETRLILGTIVAIPIYDEAGILEPGPHDEAGILEPGPPEDARLLEDGASFRILEDGVSFRLLE